MQIYCRDGKLKPINVLLYTKKFQESLNYRYSGFFVFFIRAS